MLRCSSILALKSRVFLWLCGHEIKGHVKYNEEKSVLNGCNTSALSLHGFIVSYV